MASRCIASGNIGSSTGANAYPTFETWDRICKLYG
jgi:hypothetical protein